MASHEPVDRRGELAPFAGAAALDLDARIVDIRPDFAAMMERARTLAAEAEARPPAPVIPLIAGLARDAPAASPDPATQTEPLGPFTAALRGELDAKLQARALAGGPPPRTSAPRGAPAGLVVLAIAAALLVTVSGARVLRVDHYDRGVEANAAVDPRADMTRLQTSARPAETRAPRLSPSVPGDSPAAGPLAPGDPAAPSPVPGDSLGEQPLTAPGPGHAPATRTPRAAPMNRRRAAPTEPPKPTLEDEAQLLWERGELAAAERKLREVVRIAGDSRRADLAYGDLFVLARQMLGADGQASVWREYLERFPRGRFAEDIRGSLCRRATGDERTACWRAYLTHHPDGMLREQATAAVGDAP